MILNANDFAQTAMVNGIARKLKNTESMLTDTTEWVKNRLDTYLQKMHDQTLANGRICIHLYIMDIISSDWMPDDTDKRNEVFNDMLCYYYYTLKPHGYTLQVTTTSKNIILSAYLSDTELSDFHDHVNRAIKMTTGKRRPLTHGI